MGETLPEEWSTDIVAGDFAPIIRRYGVGEAAQREVVLARFGLQQATAKGVRAPALDRERPHRDRGHPLRLQGRLGRPAVVHRPGAVLLRALLRRRLEEVGALAHPPGRPVAAQHRRALDRRVGEDGEDDAELLDPHPQLRLHPLLSRFHRATNDKGEPQEKRTPVLLAEEDFDAWLDTTPGRAPMYFGTFGKDDLEAEPAPSSIRTATTTMPLDTAVSEF